MRNNFLFGTLLLMMMMIAQSVTGQSVDTIKLFNPSFEDFPRNSVPPRGWEDCGFPGESPVDVQPGHFEVNKVPVDGNTYLGMVVRDNETWESVSQPLQGTLQAGQCYSFSIFLARSELYVSQSRVKLQDANYTTPTRLKIYGGNDYCDRAVVLAETKEIVNYRWLKYEFKFEPKSNYTYITFEVFYKTPTLFPYNGNLLLDHASDIVRIPCSEDEPIVSSKPDTTPTDVAIIDKPDKTPTEPIKITPSTPEKPTQPKVDKVLEDIKRDEIKKGDIIRIRSIYFESGSTDFTKSSYRSLSQLYKFLTENPDIKIEIGGHTNNRPEKEYADWLSTGRAKKVQEYLLNRGISPSRLSFKGYGKDLPIATNKTPEGRRLNQRVEIKITDLNEE